jgi:hypothetical protein
VATPHAGNIVRLVHFNSCVSQSLHEGGIILAAQGGVRLLRGTKILLDAKMELHIGAAEPTSAALGKLCRFREFCHAQQIRVKRASFLLLARRHRELDMIDEGKRRFGHIDMLNEDRKTERFCLLELFLRRASL